MNPDASNPNAGPGRLIARAVRAGREVAPASPSEPDADRAGRDGVLAGAGEQVAATVAPVRAGPPRPLRAGVDQRGGISVPAAPVTALAEKTVPQPDAVRVMTVRVANGQLGIAARLAEATANGSVLLVRAGRASVATVSGAVRPVSGSGQGARGERRGPAGERGSGERGYVSARSGR